MKWFFKAHPSFEISAISDDEYEHVQIVYLQAIIKSLKQNIYFAHWQVPSRLLLVSTLAIFES